MILLAEQDAQIDCPVAVAYRYVSNLERFGEWFPGVVAIQSANALEHAAVGKQYLETVRVPLRGSRQVQITVVEASPNQRLITEGALAPLWPRMDIRVDAVDDRRCTVAWRMFSRNRSALARLTIVPLARAVLRKRAEQGLQRLKSMLESKPADGAVRP